MPVPGFNWLAVLFALCFKLVDEILQYAGGLPKDLMKERPPEAKRRPLELIAATVEEERENKGTVPGFVLIESIFQQCRLSRARLSLNPEQTSVANGPAAVRLVLKQPLASPLNSTADIMGTVLHLRKGERLEAILRGLGQYLVYRADLAGVFSEVQTSSSHFYIPLVLFILQRTSLTFSYSELWNTNLTSLECIRGSSTKQFGQILGSRQLVAEEQVIKHQ